MIEFPRDRISLWKNNKHFLTFIDFFYQIALKKVRLSLTEFWRLQKTTIVYLKTKLKKTYAMGTKNWFKLGRILINLLHILKYFDILLGQFTEYNHFLMVYWVFFCQKPFLFASLFWKRDNPYYHNRRIQLYVLLT